MKLIGATNLFVRAPFLIGGILDRSCRSSDSAGAAVRRIQQSHQLRYDGVQRTVELYGIHAGIGRI